MGEKASLLSHGRKGGQPNRGVTVVSMLTASAHVWEVSHWMSKRGLGAILVAVPILASSCGGGGDGAPRGDAPGDGAPGDGAPRVTLTDKSCTYSGART